MSHTTKKSSVSWQAQVAFYLSIALAVFQIYQFRHSEEETRVAATIDIAKKYLSDPDVMKGRYVGIKVVRGVPYSAFAATEVDAWNQFILNIGYIAELLDKGRLDRAYLTQPVVCDIWLANTAAKNLPHHSNTSVLQKISTGIEQECKSTFLQ
jgi:hypothetical protein